MDSRYSPHGILPRACLFDRDTHGNEGCEKYNRVKLALDRGHTLLSGSTVLLLGIRMVLDDGLGAPRGVRVGSPPAVRICGSNSEKQFDCSCAVGSHSNHPYGTMGTPGQKSEQRSDLNGSLICSVTFEG